jgi:hypothetical protein
MSEVHGDFPVDSHIFEETVNAAWETWKRGSSQGNYFDMLKTIDAALRVAKPMIKRAVIESLATEAEGRFRDGVWDIIERETTYVEYWLRDHLPSDTDATDE